MNRIHEVKTDLVEIEAKAEAKRNRAVSLTREARKLHDKADQLERKAADLKRYLAVLEKQEAA